MNRLKYGKKQNGNNRKKGRDGGERKGGVEARQLKLSVNSAAVHIHTCSQYHVSETSGKPGSKTKTRKIKTYPYYFLHGQSGCVALI